MKERADQTPARIVAVVTDAFRVGQQKKRPAAFHRLLPVHWLHCVSAAIFLLRVENKNGQAPKACVCVGELVDVDLDRHRVAHRSVFSVRAGLVLAS